jgi:hypothetical protein
VVLASKALANRPEAFVDHRFRDKARGLLALMVRPTSRAAGRRSYAGRHTSQHDRPRIKCLEAQNDYNTLIIMHSL